MIDRVKIFEDMASYIDKQVHQESDRQVMNKILFHATKLLAENEKLRDDYQKLDAENDRLRVYAEMFDDFASPTGKNIEFTYKQTDSK